MPDLRPYLVLGVALGSVFAVSGVGMVVLYRATGVPNLAYCALGALGSIPFLVAIVALLWFARRRPMLVR
jgi:branched-subunit amino acid ABC-type transport system permease component